MTIAGAPNFAPSHGSAATSTAHQKASSSCGRSRTRRASSAAPAMTVPATASGAIVVEAISAGGDRPATSAAPVAQGSGTSRRASPAASTNPTAAIAARNSSTAIGPPSAYAGAMRSGNAIPIGSSKRPLRGPARGARSPR